MINIYPIKGGYKNGFIVVGHADYAERGQDIVCASVSALTQATLMGLEKYSWHKVEKKVRDGYMMVDVVEPTQATNVLIDTMVMALESIALQYKQHVTVWEDVTYDEKETTGI